MNSHMIELKIPMEVFIDYSSGGIVGADPVVQYQTSHVPLMVRFYLVKEICRTFTLEEGETMPYSVPRTITFEVELFTRLYGEDEKAYKAECHTVCPAFVAAWIEVEAMKQYNKEKECISSSSPSIPSLG